jgi:hypothetical protein
LDDVERLDAKAVAAQDEAAARVAPERDGEHAAEPFEAGNIPLEEGVEDGLGVAVRVEAMAEGFELFAELEVVIDLAIEDNDSVAIVRIDGLVAATEIDNFEASRTQATSDGLVHTLLVGTAVEEGVRCPRDAL